MRPHLFLVLEGDRPCSGGARHSLTGLDEVVIGRGHARSARRERTGGRNRLVVQIPGRCMSSAHARLVCTRGKWVLEDLGSKNGTFLRGDRIERRSLSDGDSFEAGHSVFVFRDALPTPTSCVEDLDSSALMASPPGLRTLLPSLAASLESLARVARTQVPVVLLGETGTGKEVVARAIHESSARRGAFVAVNCGGLSPSLVEGQLFGHVKGAFSGATRDEPGFVRSAHEGTLFLDEVGDFPVSAQPSLLRVLQEREVVPVGTTRPVRVDFRVVAATHRDVDALVAGESFRRDLLMRIDGFRHALPSLRDRLEDLGLIIAELLPRAAGALAPQVTLTSAAARALLERDWPGNVRELEQSLARALALANDGAVGLAELSLPPAQRGGRSAELPKVDAKLRDELVAWLAKHGGNVSEVARSMGKARMQIQRWMQRFEIDPETYRRSK